MGELEKRIFEALVMYGLDDEDIDVVQGIFDEARKDFPCCENCSIPRLPNPAQDCYDARHKYQKTGAYSLCLKDIWFRKWFGEIK